MRSAILAILLLLALNVTESSRETSRYELHGRTVWASGQPSRQHMRQFKDVPLVTWTAEAARLIREHWQAVQHRATCKRVMWMTPWHWGKTSQLRDWLDLAIVSVFTYNRTILENYSADKYSSWCAKGNWLNCFFEPFHGKQCDGVPPQGETVSCITEYGGDHNFLQTTSYCSRNTMRVHEAFPNKIWDKLVEANQIVYRDVDTNSPMTHTAIKQLKKHAATLYYSISLSSLKSMITKHILAFNEDIRRQADALTQNILNNTASKPMIAVHMRRTDKHSDRGSSNLEFSDRFVTRAIGIICDQYFPPNGTKAQEVCLKQLPADIVVLALSDDPTAVPTLQRHLGSNFNVRMLTDISKLLHSDKEREEYSKRGHKFFSGSPSKVKSMASRIFSYHASVFVDILAASRADILIGVGASGVSQLIAQMIGGRERVDGNALSLWQEDIQSLSMLNLTAARDNGDNSTTGELMVVECVLYVY